MNFHRWFLLLISLPLLTFGLRAGAAEPGKPAKEEVTPLGEQMDKMNGAFRKLRRQAEDATKNESSLEYVATMQAAAEVAVTLTPALAEEIPEAKRAQFIESYRAQIRKLIAGLDELEAAFKAGDNAAAAAVISDLRGIQKDGHHDYKKPDQD